MHGLLLSGLITAYQTWIPIYCLLIAIIDSGTTFNVINTQNPSVSQLLSINEQKPAADEEDANSSTSNGISMDMVEDVVLLPPFKSAVSLGYRYTPLYFSYVRLRKIFFYFIHINGKLSVLFNLAIMCSLAS